MALVGRGLDAVEIVAATEGTDRSQSDILGVEAGGTRLPTTIERVEQGLSGIPIDDVALVVAHQGDVRILDAVRTRLSLPEERVFVNVEDHGNTGSASLPLWEAQDRGRIKPGDLVLLTAFGAGFPWAAALLRF